MMIYGIDVHILHSEKKSRHVKADHKEKNIHDET